MKLPNSADENTRLLHDSIECLAPLERWYHRCHEASLELVCSGIADRVARGICPVVGGQHSWAVIGVNCYREGSRWIDPTLWSYTESNPCILVGELGDEHGHRPHGHGSIWEWGRPIAGDGNQITLRPKIALSQKAISFLRLIGPLDITGWLALAKAPIGGWPAAEIFAAMDDTEKLSALVPIDILGMTTNRNPGSMYLATSGG